MFKLSREKCTVLRTSICLYVSLNDNRLLVSVIILCFRVGLLGLHITVSNVMLTYQAERYDEDLFH